MDRLKYFFIVLVAALWLTPAQAQTTGPTIQFRGPVQPTTIGSIVPILVNLDTAGRAANAAEIKLLYSRATLEIVRIGREQSVLTLWPEEPRVDATLGTISFVGGHPNGFVAAPGTMITIYARVIAAGPATVSLAPQGAVYANDGLGTRWDITAPASLAVLTGDNPVDTMGITSSSHAKADAWSSVRTVNVQWTIHPDTQYSYRFDRDPFALPDDIPDDVTGKLQFADLPDGIYTFSLQERGSTGIWSAPVQRRFLIDSTPPDAFTLSVVPGDQLAGQAAVIWQSIDRMSGVVKYTATIDGRSLGIVTSPLIIKPEWAGQQLNVTAIDEAGNTRVASWQFTAGATSSSTVAWWWPLIGAAVLVALWVIGRRRRL